MSNSLLYYFKDQENQLMPQPLFQKKKEVSAIFSVVG
ncbi:uncharacterized protein METZ01_LOCUS107369 [marine metagenome]|uniref:Uncharacterized protein n=1 Tax=marine metagenome TaxID=408172 RepID=A0A381WPU4_9ZZZZ